jgi:hypothetical protein
MSRECVREQDVIDAIASRRWPQRADAELRDHVAACAVCADLAEVAAPLTCEHDAAWSESVSVPPADLVYWRSQMRVRAEAARRASLPMGIVHALTAATLAGVGMALAGSAAWWVKSSWTTISGWQMPLTLSLPAVDPGSFAVRVAIAAVAVCLLLAPITVYLVNAEDWRRRVE